MKQAHTISVGIMAQERIIFTLNTPYRFNNSSYAGNGAASIKEGKISVTMANGQHVSSSEIIFQAEKGTFAVEGVTIGVNFHWEAKEKQVFQGDLKLIIEGDKIRVINTLDIEDYLCSVISSEMSATSSIELLKAHAVTSRSWLLAQIIKSKAPKAASYQSCIETESERIKWYDREDHDLFDVCADDHCQRYQGITRIVSPMVQQAIDATRGQVLTSNNAICDARYYKSCGGMTERFDTAWEPIEYPYLQATVDHDQAPEGFALDLSTEANVNQWIRSNPPAFCNAQEKEILRQVLNDFDQETHDFYRWKVDYTQDELSALLKQRSGIDFGQIKQLNPLKRGGSGRISRLEIVGTLRTFTLGKELEIRKALSPSHLYSSAFVVDYGPIIKGLPQTFTLHGAGWGHGVGLCQIGAAVMADKGYEYTAILAHYFKGAVIAPL